MAGNLKGSRAAIYCRVSTEEQKKFGLSIGAQRESLRDYVKAHGYFLAGEYIDEGVSGQKGIKKRPALNQLIRDIDNIDVILFIRLDRWFRSVKLYYQAQEILDEHGVKWIATCEDYETVTAAGILKVNLMLAIAENEALRTGERIRFVFEGKKKRGEVLSGNVPLGYKIENKKLVQNPDSAQIIRDMFAEYVRTRSTSNLPRWLYDTYKIKRSARTVYDMLRNHLYADAPDPIIDRDTWETVQSILLIRSQRSVPGATRTYLFSSLVLCPECGARMTARCVKDEYYYYKCPRYRNTKGVQCGNKHAVAEPAIETWLKDNLLEEIDRFNVRMTVVEDKPPSAMTEEKLKRKISRLQDLYLDDLIDMQSYKAQYAELTNQLAQLEPPRQTPKPLDKTIYATAMKLYAELNRENRKAFWSTIIKSITPIEGGFLVDFHVPYVQ